MSTQFCLLQMTQLLYLVQKIIQLGSFLPQNYNSYVVLKQLKEVVNLKKNKYKTYKY